MAKTTIEMWVCDGCGRKVESIDGPGTRAIGFTGTVVADWTTGGGAGGEWFACKNTCIKKAVENVVEASWEVGSSPTWGAM